MSDQAPILWTPDETATQIGLTKRFLEARRCRGGGPKFCRISSRRVMYRPEDVRAWVADHVRTSTSDTPDAA